MTPLPYCEIFVIVSIRRSIDTMEKSKKVSIIRKITLSMTVLILIPIVAIGFFYIQTFLITQRSEIQNNLNSSISYMQHNIEGSLEEVNSVLDGLIYRQEFQYFLKNDNELSDKEITYFVSNFQREKNNIKYIYKNKFDSMSIYSSNKQFGISEPWQFYLEDLEQKEYYSEIVNSKEDRFYGDIRTIDMSIEREGVSKLKPGNYGTPVLPVYQKIRNVNTKEVVGVLEIDITISRLLEGSTLPEDDIHKLVLDSTHDVVFNSKMTEESFVELVVSKVSLEQGTETFKWKNETYTMSYDISDSTQSILVAIKENGPMNKYVTTRLFQIIMLTIMSIILMMFIAYWIINNMLKRLVVLDKMMSKVGEGDFDVIITDNRKNEDEMTRITTSFNNMSTRLQYMIDERIENENSKKDAELRALQAQINPHFLYNTLESMRMQCEVNEYFIISESLASLGKLFRYSISWGGNEVPFEREWENLQDYLDIMQMRFGDSLECTLFCDENASRIIVPKLILQPLVENCFNHGFVDKLAPWKLEIIAQITDEALTIIVKDNGSGIEQTKLQYLRECLKENQPFGNKEKNKESIGITNVKQRIDYMCKAGSTLEITSEKGKGTMIAITIIL